MASYLGNLCFEPEIFILSKTKCLSQRLNLKSMRTNKIYIVTGCQWFVYIHIHLWSIFYPYQQSKAYQLKQQQTTNKLHTQWHKEYIMSWWHFFPLFKIPQSFVMYKRWSRLLTLASKRGFWRVADCWSPPVPAAASPPSAAASPTSVITLPLTRREMKGLPNGLAKGLPLLP